MGSNHKFKLSVNNFNKKLLNSFSKPIFCDTCVSGELTIVTDVVQKAHFDRIVIEQLKRRGYLTPRAESRIGGVGSSLDRAYCKECKCLYYVNLETCALNYLTYAVNLLNELKDQ